MTFGDYLKAADGTAATDRLLSEVEALQSRIALKLDRLLGELDIQGGRLVQSAANVAKVEEIMQVLRDDFADERWERAVIDYLGKYDDVNGALVEYAKGLGTVDAAVLTAIKRTFKAQVAEYLTTPQSFTAELWQPIANEALGAVATGQGLAATTRRMQEIVTGTEDAPGALWGAAKTAANDSLTVYQRSAVKAAADQVGSEYFLYRGRSIDTTRPFCDERDGKAWHREEIEAWGRDAASGDGWAGMIEGTNERTIFQYLGGYSCRHTLIPIAWRDVPEEDKARMRAKGLNP